MDFETRMWSSGVLKVIICYKNLCSAIMANLITAIDELPLQYKFDITDYAALDNLALKQHINQVGQVIYIKNST